MVGLEAEMGQMEEKPVVREILETPDILALWGPGGTTPFSCQHFPIGAKNEQLFPLKTRKVLKFPYTEDQTLRFLAGLQSSLPPSLNSCFTYPVIKWASIPKDGFQSVPKEKKIPGLQLWRISPSTVISPSKSGNLTNFLRPHGGSASWHLPQKCGSKYTRQFHNQAAAQAIQGQSSSQAMAVVSATTPLWSQQLLPRGFIYTHNLSKNSRLAASRLVLYPSTQDQMGHLSFSLMQKF